MAAQCHRETLRLLRNRHDAEEAAQEALLRAWRYRDSLRGAERRDAWIRTVARNAAFRHMERRDRAGTEWLGEGAWELGAEDPELRATADRLSFQSLLAPLREAERELLWLRYIDDLPYAEIADRLDAPVGTVKVRLHRLRRRLRTLIEERQKRA